MTFKGNLYKLSIYNKMSEKKNMEITVKEWMIYVDGTHGSQPLDLSNGKILFQSGNLLPDSQAPLISALLSHMAIKGLCALRLGPSYSQCA